MTTIAYILALLLVISCGGGGSDSAPGSLVAEQTDYFDGVTYHRYYRYGNLHLGYATSTDGVHFDPYKGNPIMEDAAYPVLIEDGDRVYLVVRQHSTGKYWLYDVSVPTKPALAQPDPVLEGDYCNVAAVVVCGTWHWLIEGHDGDSFYLMYREGDGPMVPVRGDAGNPTMAYIPERKAILALYGADYKAGGWRVRAATFDFVTWTERPFVLSKAAVHIADPDLGVGRESFPLIITVGSGQASVSTYLFQGSKLELYDAIVAGHVEMEELGVTMKGEYVSGQGRRNLPGLREEREEVYSAFGFGFFPPSKNIILTKTSPTAT